MGMEMSVREKLACLAKVARKAPTDREILADQIRDAGGIVDVSITGFKVHVDRGLLEVDFPGGLTEELYSDFAPLLEPWDQAELAEAVLRNVTQESYLELDNALRFLCAQHDDRLEDWLPERVADVGFVAIAEEIKATIVSLRQTYPMPRRANKLTLDVESGILKCGKKVWRFQKRANGSTWVALRAFADQGFPPWAEPKLTESQVRNACAYLNEKTRPCLNWSASKDGILFYDIVAVE